MLILLITFFISTLMLVPLLILWIKLLMDVAPINPAIEDHTSHNAYIFPSVIEMGDSVSFQRDVFPIFQTKCSIEDCHGKKGMPGLVRYTRHSNIQPNAKRIKKSIHSRVAPMPPKDSGITLSEEELDILTEWIEAGAPNN